MRLLEYILWLILGIGIIIIVWMTFNNIFAFGQTNTTPSAVTPTPTATPVETSPSPNFQYLPQKAYVQPFKPEVGIPQNVIPLTAVPQVVPVQPVQNQTLGGFDIGSIMSMVIAAGSGLFAKMGIDKARKVEEISKEQSTQIVQSKQVEQSLAKQVYDNMPDKGASIQDAPEIRLETLADNKEEALKTAAKS